MENRGEYIRQARRGFDEEEEQLNVVSGKSPKLRFCVSILLFLAYLFCDRINITVFGVTMQNIKEILQSMPNW